jgi:signal transduction histidine kinase
MLVPGAAVKGITLSAEVSDDLPFVYADPQRVNQILTNLIDNAMKFTAAKGKISIRAEILDRDPGWVHVSVADTGCGISPEAREKVFDRLYQEERTASSRKGLGIGLHICKELVSRHGGRIWLDSKIGVGSTFHFTLPVDSLTTLLVSLMQAWDELGQVVELISVELRFDKLPPTSEPAKAAWRAAWNSLNQLSGEASKTVVMPRMTTSEEQGLIFLITSGHVTFDKIRAAASKGVADCAAVQHSACRIEVSSAVKFTNHSSIGLEQRAGEMANRILRAIARIQAEKSAALTSRLDFIGEISREVRTPATIVAGYAGMLRDKLLGELTPEQEHVVEKVLAEIS